MPSNYCTPCSLELTPPVTREKGANESGRASAVNAIIKDGYIANAVKKQDILCARRRRHLASSIQRRPRRPQLLCLTITMMRRYFARMSALDGLSLESRCNIGQLLFAPTAVLLSARIVPRNAVGFSNTCCCERAGQCNGPSHPFPFPFPFCVRATSEPTLVC